MVCLLIRCVDVPGCSGGQKWDMRGHEGGYGGSASARRDGGSGSESGGRPDVVKSGLSKVTYGKQVRIDNTARVVLR
jgi:hypothetical protein